MNTAVIIFAVFLAFSQADCRSVTREEPPRRFFVFQDELTRKLEVFDAEAPLPRVTVDPEEVTFHYMSRETSGVELNIYNVIDIRSTDFDIRRRTMFIIHGLNNNKDSPMNKEISEALLKVEDWNIFLVDWRKKANSLYPTALAAVPQVGAVAADFISLLQDITSIDFNHVYLSGHSLGAHVCGRIGALLAGQIAYIVGMDPAYPGVSYENVELRLDPSDAKHVHVIHTNGGFLGFSKPLGHADYYPNGGSSQEGCGIDLLGVCAHGRSHKYFAESILNNAFLANGCTSFEDYENGLCENNEEKTMGGNCVDTTAQGEYYLKTSGKAPFALG